MSDQFYETMATGSKQHNTFSKSQQTAHGATDTASAAATLAMQSRELQRLVGQFRL